MRRCQHPRIVPLLGVAIEVGGRCWAAARSNVTCEPGDGGCQFLRTCLLVSSACWQLFRCSPCFALCLQGSLLLVAMEWMRGGSLLQALQPPGDKRLRWAERCVVCVCYAVPYVVEPPSICLHSLKCTNVKKETWFPCECVPAGVARWRWTLQRH